jgi:DNA-binding NtrC family response regulator
MAPSALERLARYRWPGNIRELENVIERAAILSDGVEIRERDLPALDRAAEEAPTSFATSDLSLRDRVAQAVRTVERAALLEALAHEEGSPTRAARRLQISRASFYNKLKELGIQT